jgi:hypothetical protein
LIGVTDLGIDDEIGTQAFGVGELAVINVNRANVKPMTLAY